MEKSDLNQARSGFGESISIRTPVMTAESALLTYELASHALPLNTEIRRIVGRPRTGTALQKFIKRGLDLLGAGTALLLFSPVLAALGLVVYATDPGPILFSQTRVGKDGKLFRLYKFRTMIRNAEAMKKQLMKQNEMDGPAFKMKNDPRVTRFGHFLRKSSLDELPQLWNVVLGDMSLVGPRPALPTEVAQWEPWQYQRLSVEQGCTCIWQVSGRNQLSFQEWMRMDLQYVQQWSISLDIKLIFQTVVVMLTRRGAY